MKTVDAVITGEVLFQQGDIGPAELVRGKILKKPFATYLRGYVVSNIGAILGTFTHRRKLGRILGSVGIYTQRNPDTVRAADVAFISRERLAQVQSESYLDVAPELIVEVLSPDDAWSKVMEKLEEYFAIGVLAVWVADPKRQQVYVYSSLTEVERFTMADVLSGGKVLPDFSVPVAELFAVE